MGNRLDDDTKKIEDLCDGDLLCERMCFDMIRHNPGKVDADNALQIFCNMVEGDTSQLPDKLVTYGKGKGWFNGFEGA